MSNTLYLHRNDLRTTVHRATWAAGLLFAGAVLISAAPASAYVRTLTCNPQGVGTMPCGPSDIPLPIYWPTSCVHYHIREVTSTDADPGQTYVAIQESFNSWSNPMCSYARFVYAGQTNEERVGYNQHTGAAGNGNVIVFRDTNWAHAAQILALTSVTFRPSTGEIVDADIELNSFHNVLSTTSNPDLVQIDIANTITHETGHFLGLDHSTVPESTMFETAPLGELKKRSLEQDDIDGLCAVYPFQADPRTRACAGARLGFFTRPALGPGEIPPPDAGTCGCFVPARPRNMGTFAWLTLLLGAGILGSFARFRRQKIR